MYVFASIADDGRHLVLAQSQTYNMMLGPKIKQGRLVYTSPNGFKVWGGGPEKWYSEILLKSAREIILDPPSQPARFRSWQSMDLSRMKSCAAWLTT
jgi:hypothetical protein